MFEKFPSIDQYKNARKYAQKYLESPKVKYRGFVKMHGTNSCIARVNGEWHYQSRSRILTPESDNAGFYVFAHNLNKSFVPESFGDVYVYGEWCGGNIQKGVGLCELPKMFVIFAVKSNGVFIEPSDWQNIKSEEQNVFNVQNFFTHEIEIDFAMPEKAVQPIIDTVESVEKECPVAKKFGVSGIGEGLVYSPVGDFYKDTSLWFKAKGEKHSASKVKVIVAVDEEKIATIREFVEYAASENRLNQGLKEVAEQKGVENLDNKDIGDYIRWVMKDIIKEEIDALGENGLCMKDVNSGIAKKARDWFMEKS